MNVRVAVNAGPVESPSVVHRIRGRIVPPAGMAGFAHPRRSHPQQRRVVGAVRVMAVQTALHHCRVFPEERTSLVGVATRATLVHGHGSDELFGHRAVRIVAAPTAYLSAFPARGHGHVGRPLELHSLDLMALAAQIVFDGVETLAAAVVSIRLDQAKLRLLGMRTMDGMAGHAGNVAGLMLTTRPEHLFTLGVALQTHIVQRGGGHGGFLTLSPKTDVIGGVGLIFQVFTSGAVAGLAPPSLNFIL